MWSDPKAGGAGFYHASGRFRWGSSDDVLLHYRQLITSESLTPRRLSIVSVALGVGYGMGANTAILTNMPQLVQLVFGGSGIVPAAIVAIVLNVVLPKDEK